MNPPQVNPIKISLVLPLLSRLKKAGIRIRLLNDQLKINVPKGKLNPDLINELKNKKEEIIEFLKRRDDKRVKHSSIKPVEKKDYYPLSSAQKRLYILQLVEVDLTAYNITQVFELGGEDIDRLEETFGKLIAIHESLRTSFEMIAGNPVQRIHREVDLGIESYDPAARSPLAVPALISTFIRSFRLDKAPLIRVGFIKVESLRYVLMVDMHHIISDGISHYILVRDFLALYNGKQIPALKLQYKDFSGWQQGELRKDFFKRQEEYWINEFKGEIPTLNLPTDFPRPGNQSFAGKNISFAIGREDTKALNAIASSGGATLFMVLLALFNILLSKLSNQEDILVGIPVAGRRHADLEQVIGVFINTLVLRNDLPREKTFAGFLSQVKEKSIKAFENQDYQFADIVEKVLIKRDLSRNPLFDVLFDLWNVPSSPGEMPGQKMNGLQVKPHPVEYQTSHVDLSLNAVETNEVLSFTINYCTELFRKETVERMINYFKTIISSVTRAPGKKISDIDIIPEEEKRKILSGFNNTKTAYAKDKPLHELFKEQVKKTPDNIAVVGNTLAIDLKSLHTSSQKMHLSYNGLDETSGRLSILLQKKGVKPGTIVVVMMERTLELMIGIWAIMKAGGCYLPLDPNYPQERINYILADSGTPLVLASTNLNRTAGPGCEILEMEQRHLYCRGSHHTEKIGKSTDLAYVIYTSGSTGKPKGVMIQHRSVGNFIKGITDLIDFREDDNILSLTTISFDIFGLETILPLSKGSGVVIGSGEDQVDPAAAGLAISRWGVTILQVTPSLLSVLIANDQSCGKLKGLKYLLIGGEALPASLLEKARETAAGEIYNLYGPTETTIWSTVKEVTRGKSLNIGKPIANTGIYILGKTGIPQPLGIAGDLFISGAGLARGYINNSELTAKKFTTNPFVEGERLYRTGDIAKWLVDGNIEFLGRKDHQVKIRGFRIELEEIRAQLETHADIKEAVVISREKKDGEKQLAAYIVAADGLETSPAGHDLREYLSRLLPGYMVPSYFVPLKKLPLTPNRKVDRKALPEPRVNGKDTAAYCAPGSRVEKILTKIWSEILEIEKDIIGIDSNFFELGGHSLNAIIMANRIHKELNVRLPMTEVFKLPRIRNLSGYIESAAKEIFTSIPLVEIKEHYHLSSAQRQLYIIQQMDTNSTTYNILQVLELENPDIKRLEEVSRELIKRHESLRTSFETVDDKPVQKIHRDANFDIDYYNLEPRAHGTREPENGGAEVDDIIRDFIRPFDLARPPLLRVGLINRDKTRHILMVDIHHITADALSIEILVKDFKLLYEGETLSPLRLQYKDYTEWQHNPDIQNQKLKELEKYWVNEFTSKIPQLNIVTDYPRPEIRSFAGSAVRFTIGEKETRALRKLALSEGVTLYILFLTIYCVFMYKLSGQEDIVVGTVITGRNYEGLENVVGMFANTLPLRNRPKGTKNFNDLLNQVKHSTIEAFEHQDYPFEEIVNKVVVNRLPNRNPLFDVAFGFQGIDSQPQKIPDEEESNKKATVKPYKFEQKTSRFDLSLFGLEIHDNIGLGFEYCTKLFKKDTIEKFIGYIKEIVSQVLENKSIKLHDIKISHKLMTTNKDFFKNQQDYLEF